MNRLRNRKYEEELNRNLEMKNTINELGKKEHCMGIVAKWK